MSNHKLLLGCILGIASCIGPAVIAQTSSAQTQAKASIPHLEKRGQATQLIVAGKPWLMLSGELHNSSPSNAEYMRPIWKKLADMNLNTVIGAASWELIEPEEGHFDFSSVDMQITEAHKHGLKLVLIWFGIWKSTSGSYAPMWVKTDPARFPMVQTSSGHQKMPFGVSFEGISVFGKDILASDAKAFRALMRHIRATDTDHTVLIMQVENETGMFGDNRDRSPLAEEAWSKPVPPELLSYLADHKANLTPALSRAWGSQGFQTKGTWADVFGKDATAGEIFMAWHFARAIEFLTETGKSELALPMYTNGWLGPVANMIEPGQYPSGGPVAGMLDIWRAAAPKVDMLSPNLYSPDFQGICAQYARPDNPLFIPETYVSVPNLFWAIGHHAALGYSPFGIDNISSEALGSAYKTLGALAPLILSHQSEGEVMAVLQGNDASVKEFEDATGLSLKFGDVASVMAPPSAKKPAEKSDEKKIPATDQAPVFGQTAKDDRGFAIVIRTKPNQFIIAGSGILIRSSKAKIGTVDEILIERGQPIPGRRLNGDETFSGNLFTLDVDQLAVRKITTYSLQ